MSFQDAKRSRFAEPTSIGPGPIELPVTILDKCLVRSLIPASAAKRRQTWKETPFSMVAPLAGGDFRRTFSLDGRGPYKCYAASDLARVSIQSCHLLPS